ncbi:MAG: ABC transporter substrate-binding protein [Solirubrobacterales bacterium]
MRSTGAASARALLAFGGLCVALASGCNGDDDPTTRSGGSPTPGNGGALAWAVPATPGSIDPLLASARADQLVTRQIYEPLVATVSGPFGDVRRLPGLALSSSPSAGATIWSFRLRAGVRFQDGSPFNAGAVLANGRRWITTSEGQAVMPDLFAVDAPRPDLVRFFLRAPDPGFPQRLEAPQTGIVSPRALDVPSGEGAQLRREGRSGTGPFELRERSLEEVLLARSSVWWGAERDLGPTLDQVLFRRVPDPQERLALLGEGDVQIADALGPAQVRAARGQPLLDVLPGSGGTSVGLERSVRGIDSAGEIPSLAGVWLTRIGGR